MTDNSNNPDNHSPKSKKKSNQNTAKISANKKRESLLFYSGLFLFFIGLSQYIQTKTASYGSALSLISWICLIFCALTFVWYKRAPERKETEKEHKKLKEAFVKMFRFFLYEMPALLLIFALMRLFGSTRMFTIGEIMALIEMLIGIDFLVFYGFLHSGIDKKRSTPQLKP